MDNMTGKKGLLMARLEAGVAIRGIPSFVLEHGENGLLLLTTHQAVPQLTVRAEDCESETMPYFVPDDGVELGHIDSILQAHRQALAPKAEPAPVPAKQQTAPMCPKVQNKAGASPKE